MKKKSVKADEVERIGNIELARFGRLTRIRSLADQEQASASQRAMVESLPVIQSSIDNLILEIAKTVSQKNPVALLHRAYWEMFGSNCGIQPDTLEDPDSIQSILAAEYLQNLIASVKPAKEVTQELSEDELSELKEKISSLFSSLQQFLLCDSLRRKQDEGLNEEEERFRFQALMHWLFVRGERYTLHEIEHLRDLLTSQSDLIESALGVTTEELLQAAENILNALTRGVGEAAERVHEIQSECDEELVYRVSKNPSKFADEDYTREVVSSILKEKGLYEDMVKAMEEFSGVALFDLQKITKLPKSVLEKLSWEFGAEDTFFGGDSFRGWPTRIQPIKKRPFIKFGGRFYCFFMYGLFDNLYRVVQRLVFSGGQSSKDQWISNQNQSSEDAPFKYFNRLLPGNKSFKGVRYPVPGGKKNDWTEADGVIIYGDHLIVLEVKAGSFTYTSPFDDFDAHKNSLKALVKNPAKQGERFIQYLKSAEKVSLFDKDRRSRIELSSSDFRKITIFAVTVDPFTEVAAQIQHLSFLGAEVAESPVWSISLDDLRVCSEVFANPLVFLHYVEKRMEASNSLDLHLNDELEHVGLYFKVNDYALHAKELKESVGGEVMFNGYTEEIDQFFNQRLLDPDHPNPFEQKLPVWLNKILQFCSQSSGIAWASLISFLLNGSEECRIEISESIVVALKNQKVRRKLQIPSTVGDYRLTLTCWRNEVGAYRPGFVREHALTQLFLSKETDRWVLEIFLDSNDEITKMLWSRVTADDIREDEYLSYEARIAEFKERRLKVRKDRDGKIGQNEMCPCGSGLKYKKCCDH